MKTTNNREKSEVVDGFMVANCLQGPHAIFNIQNKHAF